MTFLIIFIQAYKQLAKKLLKDKAPLGAIGIQAHVSGQENIGFFMVG